MKLFFTITTVALFMSTASYADQVCDPEIDKECICEKIPVMSKDGKRILYYNLNNLCVLQSSSDSKLAVKDNDDTNGGDSSGDHDNGDSNGDNSDDSSDDSNGGNSSGDSNGDNSDDSSDDQNND